MSGQKTATTLRLTLDLTVDLNGTPESVIFDNLRSVIDNAFSSASITGDSEAEMIEHRPSTKKI